jgi:hypothetical protein
MAEPQITEIASYFASRMPTEGVEEPAAVDAWRATLRYARRTGAIEPLTELIGSAVPDDERLQQHCRELRTA